MTAWIIRGGRYGEREEEALNNGFLTIGFGIIKSLGNVQTPDDVAGCLDLSGNETNPQLASRVSQVWAFKDAIQTGDTVAMPRKGQSIIAVGKNCRPIHVPPRPTRLQPCPIRGVDQPRSAQRSPAAGQTCKGP